MKKVLYLFGPLNDLDVDWMIAHGTVERVLRGGSILKEGESSEAVFVLLQGSLVVSTRAAGELTRLEWGEVVGEMSLVDGRAASATVTAADESMVLKLPRVALEAQLARDSAFGARFFRAMAITISERLRSTMRQLNPPKGADIGAEVSGELSLALLDNVHLAGARFDRLVKAKIGPKP